MENNHEHDQFLYTKDRFLHFGCVNPFCGHGGPALPNHWKVPMETNSITIVSVTHKKEARIVTFEVKFKVDVGGFKKGDVVKVTCSDDLACCKATFRDLFMGKFVNRS